MRDKDIEDWMTQEAYTGELFERFSIEDAEGFMGKATEEILDMNLTDLVMSAIYRGSTGPVRILANALFLRAKETIPKLISILNSELYSDGQKSVSIRLLKQMKHKTKSYLSQLISTLNVENEKLRYSIAQLIVFLDEKEAIPLLIKRMKKDKDWRVRDVAKRVLEEVSKKRKYESLDDFIYLVEKKYKEKGSFWERYKGEFLVGIIMGFFGLLSTLLAILLG